MTLESVLAFVSGSPLLVGLMVAAGVYFWYVKKGGSLLHPLAPMTDDLDDTPPLTGKDSLDKMLGILATHFKDNPPMLYLIHKEAEELAFVLKPADRLPAQATGVDK